MWIEAGLAVLLAGGLGVVWLFRQPASSRDVIHKGRRHWQGKTAPIPRDRLVGPYGLGEVLRDGGTATVFRATTSDSKMVAVKIPHRDELEDREFVRNFFHEAEVGKSLMHPSIVRVLDVGRFEAEGVEVPYFAMEFLDGHDLKTIIRQEGRLPEGRAAAIARGIADALDWAHERGVVHRDIKPQNVFITRKHRAVKVMDFGISALSCGLRFKEGKGQRKAIARGTPEYMAPESGQLKGKADPKADLYALGCTLFEMLTGDPPFVASSPEEVVRMHREAAVPAVEGVSPRMKGILQRLLEKEPQRRYQSAKEVKNDLADLCQV